MSSSAHVLRMMFGILSGPMALDVFVFFSNFSTPFTVIFRFCIIEPARFGSTVVGMFCFGFVKKYNPQTMATRTTQDVLKLNKTQHKKTLKDE